MKQLNSIANAIAEQVDALSPKELQKLIRDAERVTNTNCWWFVYSLARPIREYAVDRLRFSLGINSKDTGKKRS